MRLRQLIGEIGAKYDRRLPMSSEAQMLLRRAGVELEQWIPAGYRAEGNGGTGKATATPRIAVFDPDETTTTRRGMYVAYMFAADKSTVALTLNQGVTEIAEQLGRATARRALTSQAAAIRAALNPDDIVDLDTAIDLRSTAALSADYEHATILARTYRLPALPREPTMVADLHRFIRLYAVALDARRKGRLYKTQAIVPVARRSASKKKAAPVKPERDHVQPESDQVQPESDQVKPQSDQVKPQSDSAYRRRTAGPEITVDRRHETVVEQRRGNRLMTRRKLLAALAVVPAAALAGPAVLAGRETERPRPHDPAPPQFTIDVSHHDWNRRGGNLDWAAVRNAGIVGMCARATYGDPSGYQWPTYHFGDFARAAKTAGLAVRGGYHNLVRGDQASIDRQVEWLRRELDAHDANWAMLDVERYAELVASDMWPRWDDVRRFDDRWAAVEDRVLAGYIPPWLWRAHHGQPDLRAFRGPLIASNYPLSDTVDEYRKLYARCGGDSGRGWASYGNRVAEGWQFSARAQVPGASYICGVNAWRMTSDQLTALLTRGDLASDERPGTFPGLHAS